MLDGMQVSFLLRLSLLTLLMFLILFPLEKLIPVRSQQKSLREFLFTDVLHMLVNQSANSIVLPFVMLAGMLLSFGVILLEGDIPAYSRILFKIQQLSRGTQFIICFCCTEFISYWLHRMFHKVPFLWKFHAVHHSSQEMDWLSSQRQHVFEAVIMMTFTGLPLILLGISPYTFITFIIFQKIYTAFLHANVKISFGALSCVFASPQYHHWHHSSEASAYNKNYSAFLPIFDIIFGTYHAPKRIFPDAYGVQNKIPTSFFGQFVYPLKGIWGKRRETGASISAPRALQ